jgi:hypothetical protein
VTDAPSMAGRCTDDRDSLCSLSTGSLKVSLEDMET